MQPRPLEVKAASRRSPPQHALNSAEKYTACALGKSNKMLAKLATLLSVLGNYDNVYQTCDLEIALETGVEYR